MGNFIIFWIIIHCKVNVTSKVCTIYVILFSINYFVFSLICAYYDTNFGFHAQCIQILSR